MAASTFNVPGARAFRLMNVFARAGERLSGNPLCVFEDGEGLDAATMQALARQFNLSETTFLLPSAQATARVRIFTPSYELPFAGHPTLGSAAVCRALGLGEDAMTLELAAGVIPVVERSQRWVLTARPPTWRPPEVSNAELANLLGLAPQDLLPAALWVDSGTEQLIIPLANAAAVERARPDARLDGMIRSAAGHSMAYVFARVGPDRVLARFFFQKDQAILEDPATGSACANLGGWWLAHGEPGPIALTVSQGEQVLRPSTLHLDVGADRSIRVGGRVVELGRGVVQL